MTSPRWIKSKLPNLVKCARTGGYFGRAKVGSKLQYESLKTKDFTIASRRLSKFMGKIGKQRRLSKKRVGKVILADLFSQYEKEIAEDRDLKPASKKARLYSLERLKTTWPELAEMDPSVIEFDDVKHWADRLRDEGTHFRPPGAKAERKGNSSSAVNKAVDTLVRVLELAFKAGLVTENVAKASGLKVKDSAKRGYIPNRDEFQRILGKLTPRAAFCARFIASTGCRIDEARRVLWADVDFGKEEILIRGTKTETSLRKAPMADSLRALLEEHLAAAKEVAPTSYQQFKVFPMHSINNSLAKACDDCDLPKMTNHDLRDYFATTCLESGIPVHTVANWLGHKDGGALLLKTYAHLRDQHSIKMAKKLEF